MQNCDVFTVFVSKSACQFTRLGHFAYNIGVKTKYPISKEFFPYDRFTAPTSRFMIGLANALQWPPHFFRKNKRFKTEVISIPGYQNETFRLYALTPKELFGKSDVPALIFIHGGGFIFEASRSHYRLAVKYALECRCKVFYVRYNLAPKYPFPYPQEEGYKALEYVFEHASELGIDKDKIGITGDSAGATIAVSSQLLAKERSKEYRPLFQVLVYPWLDSRGTSQSAKTYVDTPMWNARMSKKARHYTNPNDVEFPPSYISAVEYPDLSFLPKTYIEVAEFDCLHDDGVLFHELLQQQGVSSTLYQTKGTMHGYDAVFHAKTTQTMMGKRVGFILDCLKV